MAKYAVYSCKSEACGFVFGDVLVEKNEEYPRCRRCGERTGTRYQTKRIKCSVCGKLHPDTIRYYCMDCAPAVEGANHKVFTLMAEKLTSLFPDMNDQAHVQRMASWFDAKVLAGGMHINDEPDELTATFYTSKPAGLEALLGYEMGIRVIRKARDSFHVTLKMTRDNAADLVGIAREDARA